MTAARIGRARLATLLKRLEAHALGEAELNPTQIRAIELLIRKDGAAGPSTKEGEPRAVFIRFERHIVDPKDRAQ